jgi:hypothetical protein
MSEHTRGGHDAFSASGEHRVVFYGDAGGDLGDRAIGGDDALTGTPDADVLAYGDALSMSGRAQGGDDNLLIASQLFGDCTLIGDAQTMSDKTRGGDDVLGIASLSFPGTITIIGDAQTMSGNARGGNDTLISGTGNDTMWGDAQAVLGDAKGGNDTFVFKADSGQDVIGDFGQGLSNSGNDHIDVSALGIEDFSQLDISAFDSTTHESTITFSPGNEVVVHSQVVLTSQDFIFA